MMDDEAFSKGFESLILLRTSNVAASIVPCRISEVKAEVRHLYSAPNGPLKRCYRGGSAPSANTS